VPSTNATENKPTQSPTTQPPTTQPPTTQPPTTQPPTTQPPTTQPPTTQPTQTETTPTEPLVGLGIYTREELEKLPTTEYGYGPGKTSGGARAPYAESDQKKYSKYAANFIAPDNGNIYLTFDCGYEYTATDANGNTYRVTERILDILKEKNVKAVFFVTLHYCQTSPDLVQRMVDEGHAIGNHSKTHPVMPQLSIDQMIYQVTYMHDYILEHFGYEMHLFRPPTGAYSVQSLAVVQNLGYKNVHWSFAYLDYDTSKQPGYDYALNMVTGSHHSGAIYLLHAVSTTNADILGEAIDFFLAQGYNLELFN
jgi:peptidoglycan-N-acetylmuramic acid deacetylase